MAAASARRFEVAAGFAVIMAAALALCTTVAGLLEVVLVQPLRIDSLRPLVYALAVVLTCAAVGRLLQRRYPRWREHVQLLLPLVLMNTSLYGAALFSRQMAHDPLDALAFGAGCGAGFILVTLAFAAMNERLQGADVPRPFRGPALVLLSLAMLSMGFSGFTGLLR